MNNTHSPHNWPLFWGVTAHHCFHLDFKELSTIKVPGLCHGFGLAWIVQNLQHALHCSLESRNGCNKGNFGNEKMPFQHGQLHLLVKNCVKKFWKFKIYIYIYIHISSHTLIHQSSPRISLKKSLPASSIHQLPSSPPFWAKRDCALASWWPPSPQTWGDGGRYGASHCHNSPNMCFQVTAREQA